MGSGNDGLPVLLSASDSDFSGQADNGRATEAPNGDLGGIKDVEPSSQSEENDNASAPAYGAMNGKKGDP